MRGRRLYPNDRVILRELGLRDGLQLVSRWPGTAAKTEWINRAAAAGVRHIEVGSFLPTERFPQFADIRTLVTAAAALPDIRASALTLNERAVDDALTTAVSEIVLVVSATEAHSRANMRRSRQSAVELVGYACSKRKDHETVERRYPTSDGAESGPVVCAAISVAFGCPFEGDVSTDTVLAAVDKCLEAGADVIAVADTIGVAAPRQVSDLCRALLPRLGATPLVVHLHDTRGTGIANAHAALEAGVRILDGTIGGLGGCPFAPGATGNVVFEDLVYLCERCGFPTGINLELLITIRSILERDMAGEPLFGALARAGIPKMLSWSASRLPEDRGARGKREAASGR
ncbi:MAG: hydroxymethylglutaryl-CoA lyase [Paracoccaceae bacterium]|nr:hydroxymethylglutaryl-CoA lyase [Paracoccaceae bacterium]